MEQRDDIIEYSLYNHHSEEEGKKKRKTIWKVTLILSVITAVEVLLGAFIKQGSDFWLSVKILFIVLTIFKAAYIVLTFMHLGDEKKTFKWIILLPYLIFMLYLIFIGLYEGTSVGIRSL
ncbi:cytochrome C oxidase subunit IV family protein [Brumimicrobium aurantiacum]|uniref:Cytochrome C oxidase subunit IV n=1 Tax=Brumimicrobium aurantiacum TaxID=1737063 RepID=A0A3E1F1N6_9FLAO|nr:cytochrome C oxidase subunit IV family protein [Brumimicrobium aurantiacum]RFC55627.1 cytochrome C oxidase subunit IV [Brumimicrobium aurantiacum]